MSCRSLASSTTPQISSHGDKNFLALNFKLDYVDTDGDLTSYRPDFLVKLSNKQIFVVEAKGREELDLPLKMVRRH